MKYQRKLYGYQCDIYGHLNNSNYLQIYEEARSEALEQINFPIEKLMELGIYIYVTRIEIDYIKGVKLGETVSIISETETLSKIKSVWKQEIFNINGELCNRALVTGVFIREGKPFRLPKEIYQSMLQQLILNK